MNTETTETMNLNVVEKKATPKTEAETLIDLTVEDEIGTQVKGGVLIGLLLPAVQKVA